MHFGRPICIRTPNQNSYEFCYGPLCIRTPNQNSYEFCYGPLSIRTPNQNSYEFCYGPLSIRTPKQNSYEFCYGHPISSDYFETPCFTAKQTTQPLLYTILKRPLRSSSFALRATSI